MMMKRLMNALLAIAFTGCLTNAAAQQAVPVGQDKAMGSGCGTLGRHSFSLGPVTWINGYTAFYYEQAMAGTLSLQIGAGVTTRSYLNDVCTMLWKDGANNSTHFTEEHDVADHYEYYKNRRILPGVYCSLAPKFYLDEQVMNGLCVYPMVEFKNYRFQSRMADEKLYSEDSHYNPSDERDIFRSAATAQERMNCFDITLNIGRQYQFRNHITLAWNAGVGARYLSEHRLDIGKISYVSGSVYQYLNSQASFSKVRPLFGFNLTVGGWY